MGEIIISDEAYKHDGGPVLLLAGPGTGKTWQLAHRIKFLTGEKKVSADEITVITFTTEAARGMRVKLEEKGGSEFVEKDKRPSRIFTMHSLGHQILADNLKEAGLKKDFTVVEKDAIRKPLMRDAAVLLGHTEKDADKALQDRMTANAQPSEKSRKIIEKYEKILRSCNAVDYDDQISLTCRLLKGKDQLRKKYAENAKYLLVDEYQDINQAQFELIELLSRDHLKGLFVVGDDDQSIYSFRGGDPKFIREFKKHFGQESSVIQMRTSRRCPSNILECASCIAANFDSQRVPKGNYTFLKPEPGKITLHDCPSDDREAEIVGAILRSEKEHLDVCENCKQLPKRTYFILVPTKNYASKIQETLRRFKISFDSKFGDEKNSFSIFTLVKEWVASPESNFAARQAIELMIEGGTLKQLPSSRSRSLEKLKLRKSGLNKIANLWNDTIQGQKSIFEILKEKTEQDDLLKEIHEKLLELKTAYDRGSVHDFLQKVSLYTKPWSSLEKFFRDVNNQTKAQFANQDTLNVRVLTAQSSKGLQAHAVFIIGLEQEVIPRKVANDEALAEESRLFFVAMTRAEEQVHLFKCRKRIGAATYKPIPYDRQPSSFLNYLPVDKYEKQFHPAKGKTKKNK